MKTRVLLLCALLSVTFIFALFALTSTPADQERFVPAHDAYPTLRLVQAGGSPETWDFKISELPIVAAAPIAGPEPESPPPPPSIQAAAFQAISAIAASTGADVTVTLPTHVADDVFLLLVVVRDQNDTITVSGWAAVNGTPFNRGTTSRYWLFWDRATGGSETNPLVDKSTATGDTYAAVATYRGAITTGDPWEVVGTPATGTSDPASLTAITSLTAEALIVAALAGEDNNNALITTTGTDPAAYAEHYLESSIGSDGLVTFSEATRAAAGATGTVSVNFDVANPVGWGGAVLALKPPDAGGGGGMTAFLVLGDAQCTAAAFVTDADCWSTTSGGDGNGVPDGIEECIADANSGAGTGTMDAALTCGGLNMTGFTGTWTTAGFAITSTAAITIRGTMNAGASTITVNGNWNNASGTFSIGTSTVVFATAGTVTTGNVAATAYFYNMTINVGITVTCAVNTGTQNLLTVNGTYTGAGACQHYFMGGAPAWSIGGSGSVNVFRLQIRGGGTQSGGGTFTCTDWVQRTLSVTYSASLTLTACSMNIYDGTVATFSGSSDLTVGTLLDLNLGPGSALVMSAGDLTVGTNVTVSQAGNYIKWGSGNHTISGAYTNPSTSASWDAGTGTVTFNSSLNRTMTFAGDNLAEDEFATASFTGAVTFTMATRDLRAVTISIGASSVLAAGTLDLTFDHLAVDGTLTMNGVSVLNVDFDTNTGTIELTQWTAYDLGGPVVRWTFNPSATNAAVTITIADVAPSDQFVLLRDSSEITRAPSDSSGLVTFTFEGGWSSHDMEIMLVKSLPPIGPRTLRIIVDCGYNSFVLTWSCADRTDYTGWIPEVFDTLYYSYDGMEVATTQTRGGSVSFRAPGETPLSTDSDHLLIVLWVLYNGGTPSAAFVLHVDNRAAQIGLVAVGVFLLALIVAAVMRRRGGAVAFEQIQNPAYRRWPSEEFPKGWRSYRRTPHDPNLPSRSERRGNLWVIYQVRPATAAEQQRTGKKRIAYVQTVREKM